MPVNRLVFAALLVSVTAIAEDLPDIALLEFLGDYEIKVGDEWVNPLSLDIEDTSANTAQETTSSERGAKHE